jgi:hypothetical protein
MFKNRLSKEVEHLFSLSPDISDKQFSFNQIKGLPEPVQRYLKCALGENQSYISYARLRYGGSFWNKRWMTIKGEEYFTAENPGFVWTFR